jgi:hypothetical protein
MILRYRKKRCVSMKLITILWNGKF